MAALLKDDIDEACDIGAPGFVFLRGKYDLEKFDEPYGPLLNLTRELCVYASGKGNLKMIYEVFDYDIDKKSLIGPAEIAARYAVDIKHDFDNFGLLVDLSHLPLLREIPRECIGILKEYIVHAHVGNCVVFNPDLPGYGDLHSRLGFPG